MKKFCLTILSRHEHYFVVEAKNRTEALAKFGELAETTARDYIEQGDPGKEIAVELVSTFETEAKEKVTLDDRDLEDFKDLQEEMKNLEETGYYSSGSEAHTGFAPAESPTSVPPTATTPEAAS